MKSINDSRMPEYQKARARGLIERGIVPLCDALYEAGAYPLSSCDGHPWSPTWLSWVLSYIIPNKPVRPFVLFSCSFAYAKAYNTELNADRNLNYHWHLFSYIHPKSDELVWVIEPNSVKLSLGNVEPLKLKSDISQLAAIATRINDVTPKEKT